MGDENDFTSKRVLPEKQKIDESDRNKTNGDEIELIQNDSMDGAADKKHSEMNEDVKQGNSNENIQNTQEKCSPVGFAYLVPPCLSLFGFVADIAFDILLLKKYHSEGGSIITSILLMPLAFADHYRSLRIQSPQGVIDKKRDMIFPVYFVYYLGVLGGMMFRIVSISMFYAAVPPGISLTLVIIHCLLVFFWFLFYHKPSYEGMLITRVRSLRLLYKWLYTALYSVASMLFFVDLYESEGTRSSSKNRMICYNVVLYIESTVFIVLGFVWASLDIELYATVLLVGFLLHVVFIPNYYQFLHPTVGICNSCAETSETVTTEQVENIVSNPQQSNPAEPAAKD